MPISFNEFKDKAAIILNINFDSYKLKRVQRRADSLMSRYNIVNYDECLELLEKDEKFRAAYLNHFTINTSEFFRNPKNFQYLQDKILPEILRKNNKIKIWSAPCSNGSEPYTLAIILEEMKINPDRYTILASDLDPDILETAKTGIYDLNSLKNVSPQILSKYFKKLSENKNKYQLKSEIIKRINFERKDLIHDSYHRNCDLILCRNFFIYLTKEEKDNLTRKFVEVLREGAYLFLGNTEFIFTPEKFNLRKIYSSFYTKDKT
jgi:chemotaxis protein methyltransferase CheR